MAQIVLTIDDTLAQRVLDGFAGAEGYTGFDGSGVAETKSQFLKRKLSDHVKRSVQTWEASQAAQTAASTAAAQIIVT